MAADTIVAKKATINTGNQSGNFCRFLLLMICCGLYTNSHAQPSAEAIEAHVKKEMGITCTGVKITGSGKLVEEFENGAWVKYYRVPVNALLKTAMPGVTRLMKGAAVYTSSAGIYSFKKYNTASGEYIGLPAPDMAAVTSFISSLPDMALGGRANRITKVESSVIENTSVKWHTLLSVSIPCVYTYWYKKDNTTLEKVKEPFELRLYRKDVNSAWHQATLINPDAASDARRREVLGTRKYNNEKTIIESRLQQQAAAGFNKLPGVTVPPFKNSGELAVWFNDVLLQEDEGKAESAFLNLVHPSQKNSAGLLNGFAADMLAKIKAAVKNDFSKYSSQYCKTLSVKEQTPQTVEWWNKDKTKFSRIIIREENGKMYVAEAAVHLWQSFNSANAQRTMNTPCR